VFRHISLPLIMPFLFIASDPHDRRGEELNIIFAITRATPQRPRRSTSILQRRLRHYDVSDTPATWPLFALIVALAGALSFAPENALNDTGGTHIPLRV
jgi:hypothetical protein